MAQNKLPSFLSEDFAAPMFQNLQREMNQLMERFRNQPPTSMTEWMSTSPGQMMPALDVSETDEALEISAEIPGVGEDDIEVTVTGDILTLRGEKSIDREEKEKDYHLVERSHGRFRRQIPLGFVPDEGGVDAKFGDGLLVLTITKPTEAKSPSQKVTIKKS